MSVEVVSMASQDQNSHVALHLDYFDVRNAMVPLRMLLASCDIDVSNNGIK